MGGRGTVIVDFGDGAAEASVEVAAPGILAPLTADSMALTADMATLTADMLGSQVEVWFNSSGTPDHDAEEHRATDLRVTAGSIVQGAKFTVWITKPENHDGADMLITGRWAVDYVWV